MSKSYDNLQSPLVSPSPYYTYISGIYLYNRNSILQDFVNGLWEQCFNLRIYYFMDKELKEPHPQGKTCLAPTLLAEQALLLHL